MSETVLKVQNLHKHFGSKHIINDISFELQAGEILGFLGPNGSGKTTTIKMILGLLDADSGSVEIGGFDRVKDFEKAMSHIGGIIENPDTYGYLSGYKNLELYQRMRTKHDPARINEVVSLVGLDNRIRDKVKTYSLGMKQRLGLAQAILHYPKVFILDEPTNGLDPAGIKELRDILKKLSHEQGIAVLVSSHILSEMQLLCDRVCIINAGQVLMTETLGAATDSGADGNQIYDLILGSEKLDISGFINTEYPDSVVSVKDGVYSVSISDADLPELIKKIAVADIRIYGVAKIKKSLEESFMEITGGGNKIV